MMSLKKGTFNNGINIDPKHLIELATQNKLPWEALATLLDNAIYNIEISKQVIKILLHELEIIHLKYDALSNEPLEIAKGPFQNDTALEVPKEVPQGSDFDTENQGEIVAFNSSNEDIETKEVGDFAVYKEVIKYVMTERKFL